MTYDFYHAHGTEAHLLKDVFTEEESILIQAKLEQDNFQYLDGKSFKVICKSSDSNLYIRVLLHNQDKSFYYPIDAQFKLNEKKQTFKKTAPLIIDYIQAYLTEYFQDPDTYLTIEWGDHEMEGLEFLLKGQIFNVLLEEQANQFMKNKVH